MGNYVVLADVQTFVWKGETVDLSSFSDDVINSKITLAEEIVEYYTNDIFYSKTETNYFDGNGLVTLFFSPQVWYKLLSATTVKEKDVDGTVLHTYTENLDFVAYDQWIEVVKSYSGDRARRKFGRSGVWPKGQKNIEIAGTWGSSSTPEQIKEAVSLLTISQLDPDFLGLSPVGISEVEFPEYRIEFLKSRGGENDGVSTGYSEVDRLLCPFINNSVLFGVVPSEKQCYD